MASSFRLPGRRFLLLLLLWAFLARSVVSAANFSASLDRETAIVGETVELKVAIENGKLEELSGLPKIDGLEVASGVSSSVNSSVGPNGSVTVQSYTVALRPKRAGDFVIPPFTAKIDGQTMRTQPIPLKVAADDTAAPPAELANSPIFLWLVPPKSQLFVNEMLPLELRLYVRNDIRQIGNIETPLTGDGLVFSKRSNGTQSQRTVGSSAFTMISFRVVVTPVQVGTLTMTLENGSLVVNPRDPFVPEFFGPPPQRVRLTLAPQTFQVLPLPSTNVPEDFSGAVGQFALAVDAGPTNVAVGDPITVRIQISGTGRLETVALPNQSNWQDFKVYPPTFKTRTDDELGVRGTKLFEEIVVPQTAAIKALPPFSFSYFDPEKGAYQRLVQAGIPLTVRAVGATVLPTVAAKAEEDQRAKDIVQIRQRLGSVMPVRPPLLERQGFLALQAVPILAFAASVIWRRKRESLAANPRLRRRRQVEQAVREGLAQLRQLAGANQSDEFFATLFRLLQEQIGERLDLPSSSITEAVIEEHLRPRGISESAINGLHELFQLCNQARYAPVKSSEALAAVIPKLETAVRELREVKA